MAEQAPTPALMPTADTNPYVPVSWMAVAAVGVAGLFVGFLILLGGSAFFGKKPLIMPELLVLPVVGVVLSFAARRLIRNSEGTRAGEGLANAAWWACLVGGLAYAAYLFGIDYSVRRDAENEAQRWVGYVTKGEPNRAFIRLLDPARRSNLNPDDTNRLRAEFRSELLIFDQTDLVRLAARNPGACEYQPRGLKDWTYKPTGIDCVFTGVIKCPEGTFPLDIAMKGVEGVTGAEGGGGRQWTVANGQNGFFQQENVRRTPYGWLVTALESAGVQAGQNFIRAVSNNPQLLPHAYAGMIRDSFPQGPLPGGDQAWTGHLARTVTQATAVGARVASFPYASGPLVTELGKLAGTFPPTAEYAAYFPDRFYKLPGGADPSPEDKKRFLAAWSAFGIVPPGTRIQNSPDTNPVVSITDAAVEVRIPVEIPIPGQDSAAARGRLVLACTDPAVLGELKQLRANANPDDATKTAPEELARRVFNWRVVRLESDLYPIRPMSDRGPPGGMGGMPGG